MNNSDLVNCKEDQNDEISALQAIYYNEFEMLSESPFYKFEIIVRYQPPDDSSKTHFTQFGGELPSITLRFEYTEKYPLEAPAIEIAKSKQVPEKKLEHILEKLVATAQRTIGSVMIYNIVVDAQEIINRVFDELLDEKLLEENGNVHSLLDAQMRAKEEAEYEKKLASGTKVTPELFEEWRNNFEMEMKMKDKLKFGEKKSLTGRELFKMNATLNVSDLQFTDDASDEPVLVDESLFSSSTLDDDITYEQNTDF